VQGEELRRMLSATTPGTATSFSSNGGLRGI
jgi:hypothetical protein